MVYEENMDFSTFEEKKPITRRVDFIKVYEIYNRKHWYHCVNGTMWIGCEKTYLFDYDSLNDDQKGNCDAYTDAIDASNTSMAVAITGLALLIVASKGTLTAIGAMVLKLAGEGMTKKQIAKVLMKKLAVFLSVLESHLI
jgi:hypothetical protein